MTDRFTAPVWAEPATWTKPPTVVQIAATGRAFPEGAHELNETQQREWFGGVIFNAPVEWDGEAFVSGDTRLTPAQIVRRASEGR